MPFSMRVSLLSIFFIGFKDQKLDSRISTAQFVFMCIPDSKEKSPKKKIDSYRQIKTYIAIFIHDIIRQ